MLIYPKNKTSKDYIPVLCLVPVSAVTRLDNRSDKSEIVIAAVQFQEDSDSGSLYMSLSRARKEHGCTQPESSFLDFCFQSHILSTLHCIIKAIAVFNIRGPRLSGAIFDFFSSTMLYLIMLSWMLKVNQKHGQLFYNYQELNIN